MKYFLSNLLLLIIPLSFLPAQDSVHVKAGWNIIGSLKDGAVQTILTSVPDTIISSTFYGYDPAAGYQTAETLGRGAGYWVKVKTDGIIVFNTPTPQDCGRKLVLYEYQIYHTVQIGEHCWLDGNLNVGTMVAGSGNQTDNALIEKYCYNDDPSNCLLYGGLYQWDEAMQYVTTVGAQGICPSGWHVATYSEYQGLSAAAGDDGNALKMIGQGTGEGTGTNSSGFSALLAGYRVYDGTFNHLDYAANVWSSTEYDGSNASNLTLYGDNQTVDLLANLKTSGFSVRCFED